VVAYGKEEKEVPQVVGRQAKEGGESDRSERGQTQADRGEEIIARFLLVKERGFQHRVPLCAR